MRKRKAKGRRERERIVILVDPLRVTNYNLSKLILPYFYLILT